MRSHVAIERTPAPPVVHDVLRSPGRPLEPAVRGEMEGRFGHDFSRVRIHSDSRAAESARAVNANAYTVGSDVVFGSGRYAPGTATGARLLAHELAHVRQQAGAASPAVMPRLPVAESSSPLEREADVAAGAGKAANSVPPLSSSETSLVREPDEDDERAKAVAEAEAVAARIEKQLAEADVDEPDPKSQPKTPSRFSPGGFTDEVADELAKEAESRIKLGSMALTLAERQARRREFWARNPGYNSADVKEAFDLDLYWDPNEEGFIRQPYVDDYEAIVDRDPEAHDLYSKRYSDLWENKPEKKSRFTRAIHFVCEHTEPCSSNIEQFRKDQESGMSRDEALNKGMARLVVTAETMMLPTPGPSGPIKIGPGGTPTGMPFEVPPTEGPSLGGPEPATVPAAPAPKPPRVSEPILTTGGKSGEPPAGKVEPGKVEAPAPEPAPEVAPPAPSQPPGTVTVEASRQAGLVKPGGRLDVILQSIQSEFAAARPRTLKEAMDVVGRGTSKVGFARGIRRPQTTPDEIVLDNPGTVTTVRRNGEIIVMDRGGQVVLHLKP